MSSGSLRRDGLDAELTPQIYLPAAQTGIYPVRLADVAVRGNGGAGALAALVRAEVQALDPEQPISRVMSLDEALARGVAPRRFGLALLAGFALTALVLTLVGIYGVAAYSVGQRTPELGVRMALGADRGSIRRLVVRSVLAQVAAGSRGRPAARARGDARAPGPALRDRADGSRELRPRPAAAARRRTGRRARPRAPRRARRPGRRAALGVARAHPSSTQNLRGRAAKSHPLGVRLVDDWSIAGGRMAKVTAFEAKTRFGELLDRVSKGRRS